jgi:hypothetical protein
MNELSKAIKRFLDKANLQAAQLDELAGFRRGTVAGILSRPEIPEPAVRGPLYAAINAYRQAHGWEV